MENKKLNAVKKATKNFEPTDYDDLMQFAKTEKARCIQRLKKEKEKKAAEILLKNMNDLLKNKENLPPEFAKQLESLSGNKVVKIEKKEKVDQKNQDSRTAA